MGRDEQRRPVAYPQVLEHQPRQERPQHVEGAVAEVDDVEQPEDDRQAEAEQRVERAVDQPHQELAEQRLDGDSEDGGHRPGGDRLTSRR